MALVHAVFAALFQQLGADTLVWVNVGLVLWWLSVYALLRRHHNTLAVLLI